MPVVAYAPPRAQRVAPRPLVVRAWLWLAALTDDLQQKRRCLNAVLYLDPHNEPASLALLLLDQKRPPS